jgi:hypothetical protein
VGFEASFKVPDQPTFTILGLTAYRVAVHILDEASAHKRTLLHRLPEFDVILKVLSVEIPAGVDGGPILRRAESSDPVEDLQSESDRIREFVAVSTGRARGMRREPIACRFERGVVVGVKEAEVDVRGRGGNRLAKE